MATAGRLIAAFFLATLVALLCAGAVLRRLPADPRDAMTAAGMLLMLIWPVLIIAAIMPARARIGWTIMAGMALVALVIGWMLP